MWGKAPHFGWLRQSTTRQLYRTLHRFEASSLLHRLGDPIVDVSYSYGTEEQAARRDADSLLGYGMHCPDRTQTTTGPLSSFSTSVRDAFALIRNRHAGKSADTTIT